MTTVTIPDTVTNLGDDAFGECSALTNVSFQGNAPACGSSPFFSDNATVYYLIGTTGWSSTFAGLPAIIQSPFWYTTNMDNTLTITLYTGTGGA